MNKRIMGCVAAALSAVLVGAAPADAAITLNQTRVIYTEGDPSASIQLNNAGEQPALVQDWIDEGDRTSTPQNSHAPFMLTPPVVRIDPHRGQTLQLTFSPEPQDPVAQDRESVFWLNVLDIPPKPDHAVAGQNTLQIALRSRIKIFYRPKGLRGSPADALQQARWSLLTQADGKPCVCLQVRNPTPYHISFTTMEMTQGGKTYATRRAGMAEPMSTLTIPLDDAAGQSGSRAAFSQGLAQLHYHYIDDYGAELGGDIQLKPAAP